MPDVIIDIDLDDEDVQAEFFKQFMSERLMKCGSEEEQDIRQCENAEAVGFIKEIELNGKKIAENDTEAEAILEYLIANRIYEHKSGKVILLDDLPTLKGVNQSRLSRWITFLDIVIEMVKESKRKAEAIKKRYEAALSHIKTKTTLSPSDKLRHYLELIMRIGDKHKKTGTITQDERNTLRYAMERYSMWQQREKISHPNIFVENIKESIKEGLESLENFLADIDYVISVLLNVKDNLRQIIETKNEELLELQKLIMGIVRAAFIQMLQVNISEGEIEKDVEKI